MQSAPQDSAGTVHKVAQKLVCGSEASFCSGSLKSSFLDTLHSDACALGTRAVDNEHQYDYHMWTPSYANNASRGSAFLNASSEAIRFAPRKITQESFLQGRGQVSSNPGCKGSSLVYLPEEVFAPGQDTAPRDMHLFAHPTVVPRSCSSLTELDIIDRMKPRKHAYQGRTSALQDALQARDQQRPRQDGVTLSNKTYPDFFELSKKDRYSS